MDIKKDYKLILIGLLFLIVSLFGLVKKEDSRKTEVCYKGLTYVHFGAGSRSWGAVMFDQNGSVVKCKEE